MTQGGNKSKGQGHASEIRRQARKTHQDAAHPAGRIPYCDSVRHKKTKQAARYRGNDAYLQAGHIGLNNRRIR